MVKRKKWDREKVLEFLDKPRLTREVLERFGGSYPTTLGYLKRLMNAGYIKKVGTPHKPRWIVGVPETEEEIEKADYRVVVRSKPLGVMLVNALAENPMTAAQLVEQTDIPIAAMYRLLQKLLSMGFIVPWERKLSQKGKRVTTYISFVKYKRSGRYDDLARQKEQDRAEGRSGFGF